jgi:arginine decarboxylase-like protein
MVAKVNNWSLEQKGLYLAVSLRGQAQAILGDLHYLYGRKFTVISKCDL